MSQHHIYTKINALPAELQKEVNDFIDFLLSKKTLEAGKKVPVFGCAKGQIIVAPDFDEPLENFKEYMEP